MNGILLGMALLVSSPGVSPNLETPLATRVAATFTFDLSDRAVTSPNLSYRLLNEQSRQLWRRAPVQPTQAPTAKRCTTATRIVAVVAGAFSGWMAGGMIGGYATAATAKRDDDGVTALKGVMIGAPIGAVVGGVIGYRLTK